MRHPWPLEGAASMQFLFLGFVQNANIRSYRFQGVVPAQRPSRAVTGPEFLLTADMGLLAQHRIRVQDGLTLCLKILSNAFGAEQESLVDFSNYAVTVDDVSAFSSARTAIEDSKIARRKHRPPFKPSPSSQLKWPRLK
jgi:hypothetical protein